MANDLTNLIPKIIARGLLALRRQALLVQMVNRDYSGEAAQKGDVINVPGPVSGAVRDAQPGPVPVSAQDLTPGNVQITLANWKEFPFYVTDKDRVQIDANGTFVPMAVSEAMKQLANTADSVIAAEYKGVYGYTGTAGTTPFQSTGVDAVNARKILNNQLAPVNDRRLILNPDAEANALLVPTMTDLEKTGDSGPKIEGQLGRKYGFNFGMSQSLPSHTAGTAATIIVGSTTAAGSSTLDLRASTNGTVLLGDIFTIAGNTQTYVVTDASVAVSSAASSNVNIAPALAAQATAGTAVTLKASHAVSLAFQFGAFTFADRPLASANDDANQLGSKVMAATDPVTGMSLRLEVTRQNKQTQWSFDHLYGAKLVRREFACRVAG